MRNSGALVVVALLGGAMSFIGGAPAFADTVTRDALSRKFKDFCVFTEYKVEGIDRMSMIDKCDCAVKQAMTGFTGDSFESPSRSKLTGDQEKAIREAIGACFARKK
jgi:hypothetical protein